MPKISCENLTVMFLNKRNKEVVKALDDLSVEFESEKFSLVLGSSGCGKTTLLRVIAGLEKHIGKVYYNGLDSETIEIQKKNISFVSQNYVLYPHMTIFDNIAYPLKATNTPRDEIINRVNAIAEKFELTHCLSRKPKHLSGGQQQRVAIARAFIKKVLTNTMSTVIFVTHNVEDAYSLADKIYIMDEGKIIEEGTPTEIINSSNQIVKDIMGIN